MKKSLIKKLAVIAAVAAVLVCAWFAGGKTAAPAAPRQTQPAAAQTAQAATAEPEASTAPEATPAASAPAASAPEARSQKPSCTISISCAALCGNMDALDKEKRELVPKGGVVLAPVKAEFTDGESVFDVLQRVCRENGIQLESTVSPAYNTAYIEGIANLYEFDAGETSGWMYSVNGAFPGYGSSAYKLADGDTVCWVYTTDLGADVGGGNEG
jgi:pyruvate/2-oxoglutarate dehydrogenase complex dihydrolipoamide acyltransferase (E2) component